jgi:hypothetical protein
VREESAMKVKKVEVYETTDFATFKNKEEALVHQNGLNLKECVENWVETWGWSGMSKSDLIDLVVENVVENIDDLINELTQIGVIKG